MKLKHITAVFSLVSILVWKKSAVKCAYSLFSCCWNFTTPLWLWQTHTTSWWHTYWNQHEQFTLPMVRKQFKKLRNFFCVRAASQLLKIYRTIKTGGWKKPWDKFRLLLSGYICVCVKHVRASLWYYAFSGCLGIVLLPCQSYKMVQ